MRSWSSGLSPGSPPSRRGIGCRARRRSWCLGPRSSSARTCGAEWSLVIITISGNSGRPVRDGSPSQKALMDRVLIAFENILQFWGRHGLSTFGWDYLFSSLQSLSLTSLGSLCSWGRRLCRPGRGRGSWADPPPSPTTWRESGHTAGGGWTGRGSRRHLRRFS